MVFSVYKLKPYQKHYIDTVWSQSYELSFKIIAILLLLKMTVAIIFTTYKLVVKETLTLIGGRHRRPSATLPTP